MCLSHNDASQFEQLIEGVMEENFSTQAAFFLPELIAALRQNLLRRLAEGRMHPAGVGKHFSFQQNLEIRSDVISWVDERSTDPAERQFLDSLQAFIDYLNRTCYTGINGYEFHYALYEAGSFYKKHLDRFQQDSGRRYSLVIYLNEDWQAVDGGQLVAYLDDREVRVSPEGGRVVFFKSDEVPHEVELAQRRRMSISGWLLRS